MSLDQMYTDALKELEEVKEERDDLEHRYHLLASEMVYEGNSVQHWKQKALAYKECAGAIYELKQALGVETPAAVVEAVTSLSDHVVALESAGDALNEAFEAVLEGVNQIDLEDYSMLDSGLDRQKVRKNLPGSMRQQNGVEPG